MPARWCGGGGLPAVDSVSTVAFSPRKGIRLTGWFAHRPRLCRFALLLWILRVPAFWRVPGLLKNMRGAIEALLRLEDGTVGAARVYDEFLSIRASLLNLAFDAGGS